ncbi:hypothetical protein QM797_10145 [Rhodococcus sp. IEGM 1381]|uniref:hypothetical protein n=1 Tax=Rhodococcus sp. IEGM 1381 TaxID=3047085 RepID=UPI0024B8599C|nr:hypothetical protein [Rhodococcus sp. IEGM 1381]MDI9895086.1 hypothetical protein [Rhodococcus sp. IEGM 1381]
MKNDLGAIYNYKESIGLALGELGVDVYGTGYILGGGMRKQAPPYVQMYPAEDYIQVVNPTLGENDFSIAIRLNLSIIAGPEDKESSMRDLDDLLKKCLSVVRNLDDVEVTSFVAIDRDGGRLLAANIAFSNELTIEEGEL